VPNDRLFVIFVVLTCLGGADSEMACFPYSMLTLTTVLKPTVTHGQSISPLTLSNGWTNELVETKLPETSSGQS